MYNCKEENDTITVLNSLLALYKCSVEYLPSHYFKKLSFQVRSRDNNPDPPPLDRGRRPVRRSIEHRHFSVYPRENLNIELRYQQKNTYWAHSVQRPVLRFTPYRTWPHKVDWLWYQPSAFHFVSSSTLRLTVSLSRQFPTGRDWYLLEKCKSEEKPNTIYHHHHSDLADKQDSFSLLKAADIPPIRQRSPSLSCRSTESFDSLFP